MVLEPWITPSLFYQFLNKPHLDENGKNQIAMDSYTFCEVLGPKEGNRWLQGHWATWITEDYLDELVKRGIQRVRLPIGDWTLN
jgi:glucan 1,3-beta-glucosidase